MTSHAYWRVYINQTAVTSSCAISEISMAAATGGSNQISGGTASASVSASGYPPSNACDGNAATYWLVNTGLPAWWQYQFASAVAVSEIKIISPSDSNYSAAPVNWYLQYSDDGSTWYNAAPVFVSSSWASGQTQTFEANFEAASKLTGYAALSGAGENVSKLVAYSSLSPTQQEVTKLTSYANLSPQIQQVSKLMVYAILQPGTVSASHGYQVLWLT